MDARFTESESVMSKAKIQLLAIGLTVLCIGAGVVSGMLASRLPVANKKPVEVAGVPTPLVAELGLTPEQQDQMRQIWESVRTQVHACFDDAEDLQKQRDEALVALLNDQQKAQFEKMSKDFADRYAALEKQRQTFFDDAVERTKKLLNDEQRKKYEEILSKRVPPGPRRGH